MDPDPANIRVSCKEMNIFVYFKATKAEPSSSKGKGKNDGKGAKGKGKGK